MVIALDKLPDDVEKLKVLVANQSVLNQKLQSDKQATEVTNKRLSSENQRYKAKVSQTLRRQQ